MIQFWFVFTFLVVLDLEPILAIPHLLGLVLSIVSLKDAYALSKNQENWRVRPTVARLVWAGVILGNIPFMLMFYKNIHFCVMIGAVQAILMFCAWKVAVYRLNLIKPPQP